MSPSDCIRCGACLEKCPPPYQDPGQTGSRVLHRGSLRGEPQWNIGRGPRKTRPIPMGQPLQTSRLSFRLYYLMIGSWLAPIRYSTLIKNSLLNAIHRPFLMT
ncbi:hypothetical protein [Adlercreutzia sp.]|uniref:hypothetical protein n=1 Tax=Adlercreutzia sp. TaxID=1872387 RepID=UPI003A888011